MKTRHYMLAVATLILAACNQKELQEDAPASFVGFDTYTAHATKAGTAGEIISKEDLQKIAETKMPDLNAASLEAAMSMVAGTARSMGIVVED